MIFALNRSSRYKMRCVNPLTYADSLGDEGDSAGDMFDPFAKCSGRTRGSGIQEEEEEDEEDAQVVNGC